MTLSAQPKHYRVERADVRVEVQPDASLHVTEQLEFNFSGDFSGAYRDVHLAEGVRAHDVRVSEDGEQYTPGGNTELGSYDRPGTFGAEQLSLTDEDGNPIGGFRVVWHYTALDETRTFQVEYDVTGAARAYGDVVDVPWAVWGHQWEFWLDDLDAEIALAAGSDEPLEAWLRPRKLGVDPDLAPGSASVEVERLPPQEETVLRAVFPRDAFASVAGASEHTGSGLEAVRAEEAAVDDEEGLVDAFAGFVGANIVLLEVIWTALVVGIAMALYIVARDRRSQVARYLSEPPEDIPPALAYALAEEGKFDDRLVLATLLDLVDRGFYEGRASEGEALDLRLSVPGERPADTALTEYERDTLEFFDGLLEEGPGDLGRLKERVPQHSSSWRTKWENLRESLDRAEEGEMKWDRDLTSARSALALVAFAGYAVLGPRVLGPDAPGRDPDLRDARRHDVHLPAARHLAEAPRPGEPRASRAVERVLALDPRLPPAQRRSTVDAQAVAPDPRLRRRLRNGREGDRVRPDPGAGDAGGHHVRGLAGAASGRGALRRHPELRGLRVELHEPGRTAVVVGRRGRRRLLGRGRRLLGRRGRRRLVAGRVRPIPLDLAAHAAVAELVDAPSSGGGGLTPVEVRVLSAASFPPAG